MVELEHQWPCMNTMPLLTMVLATDTACLGSQASSPTSSLSFSPSTPPRALMSAIAISAPLRIWSPAEAYWPVMGPAMATDRSARAEVEKPPSARTAVASRVFFMKRLLRGCGFVPCTGQKGQTAPYGAVCVRQR